MTLVGQAGDEVVGHRLGRTIELSSTRQRLNPLAKVDGLRDDGKPIGDGAFDHAGVYRPGPHVRHRYPIDHLGSPNTGLYRPDQVVGCGHQQTQRRVES